MAASGELQTLLFDNSFSYNGIAQQSLFWRSATNSDSRNAARRVCCSVAKRGTGPSPRAELYPDVRAIETLRSISLLAGVKERRRLKLMSKVREPLVQDVKPSSSHDKTR